MTTAAVDRTEAYYAVSGISEQSEAAFGNEVINKFSHSVHSAHKSQNEMQNGSNADVNDKYEFWVTTKVEEKEESGKLDVDNMLSGANDVTNFDENPF